MGKESSDKSDSVSSRKLVLPGDLLETKSKPGRYSDVMAECTHPF